MACKNFFTLIALYSVIYFYDEVKADCGGLLVKPNGTTTSPSYPLNYPLNQNCTWEIKMPPNNRILTHFKHLSLERHQLCLYDSVTLKSKMPDGEVLEHGRYCGNVAEIPNIISRSNILLVEFISDGSNSYSGFEMEYYTVSNKCGRLIEESEGVITSPFFPLPYPTDMHCTWNIQAPPNHNIQFIFTKIETEDDDDYVSLKSKMTDGEVEEHGKFYGISRSPPVIYSKSNILLVEFVSNNKSVQQNQGFRAEFLMVGCGGLISGSEGTISTPFYPELYPPNKVCEWTILVPPRHKIKLNFLTFQMEEGENCRNDFLQIQSNSTEGEIHEYGKYCDFLKPRLITSEHNLILKFVSDRSVQKQGFKAEYSIDKFTDFESSILTRSTTPDYKPFHSTIMSPYENASTELSSNEERIFSEPTTEDPTTLWSDHQPTSSTSNSFFLPPHFWKENQEEDENLKRNETSILSALKVLTKKVVSIEEKQEMLLNRFENMFNTLKMLTEKVVSIEERQIKLFH